MAQACKCQLLLMDNKTYYLYYDRIKNKMRLHGIDDEYLNELREDIDAYGCIAVLKANKPIGSEHIAQCFSSVKLNKSDIKRLNSIEARKHPDFGDLDSSIPANRRKFFYSFPVVVSSGHTILSFFPLPDCHTASCTAAPPAEIPGHKTVSRTEVPLSDCA